MLNTNEHDISRLELQAVINGKGFPVESWKQVSDAYRRTIEHLGLGASNTPECTIVTPQGQVVAHCSFNGKIWAGGCWHWTPGSVPIYDPTRSN